jgi:predicted ribosome quality control (RQC) complex YloA/Tae2 family protein
MLLMESGIRFHTTKYARDKNDMPSPFAMKLRKFIRTKRLEDVRQLGSDRVVDFKFGSGDSVCHIILELYATGNIVLTDGNYEIQGLLRSHQFEEDVAVKMHEIYPIAFTTSMEASGQALDTSILNMSSIQFLEWSSERERSMQAIDVTDDIIPQDTKKSGGKKSKTRKMTLRQLLLCKESGVALFGPEILDHCILSAGLSPTAKVEDTLRESPSAMSNAEALLRELSQGPSLLSLLTTPGQLGYILCRDKKDKKKGEEAGAGGEEYYDFVPRCFIQHQHESRREFSSFDETVDEYFCKVSEVNMSLGSFMDAVSLI